MHCYETDGKLPAIHCEHLDTPTIKRLNKVIGLLKAGFEGNARLTLVLSGGNVDDVEIFTKAPPEKHKRAS